MAMETQMDLFFPSWHPEAARFGTWSGEVIRVGPGWKELLVPFVFVSSVLGARIDVHLFLAASACLRNLPAPSRRTKATWEPQTFITESTESNRRKSWCGYGHPGQRQNRFDGNNRAQLLITPQVLVHQLMRFFSVRSHPFPTGNLCPVTRHNQINENTKRD